MTVKEKMLQLQKDCFDIDFVDDYDERAWCAYCGTKWSEKAEKKYEKAFNLPIQDDNENVVIVHCKNGEEATALKCLLLSMAGYLEHEDEYEELYPEETEINENLLLSIMKQHAGHNVSIVSYADGENMSLECKDCGCVLFDSDVYDLIGVI